MNACKTEALICKTAGFHVILPVLLYSLKMPATVCASVKHN